MNYPATSRSIAKIALLALASSIIVSPDAPAAVPPEHWVGTWAAAPQPLMPGALQIFENQSVRLIVHTSVGGSKIRIRFSNLFGSQPLALAAIHVARARGGEKIISTTDRPVRFGGKPATIIGAHQEAISDAVDLDIPASSTLAITMFFSRPAAADTSHFLALQTGYVSPKKGNFTPAAHFPIERTINSWPFLTGVDVLCGGHSGTLVVFGDSTVDGDGSSPNSNHRWPDLLFKRLATQNGTRDLPGILNEGIIGNRLLLGSPRDSEYNEALGESGLARFARDALDRPGVTAVIVRTGGNDLGFPGSISKNDRPATAASLIAGYRQLISLAHARGVRIIGTTISPFEGAAIATNFYTPEKESVRQQVNSWLRQQHEFDGLIDVDSVLRDPERPSRLRSAYDSGDHIHPSNAGYAAAADAVDLSLLQ